MKKLLYIILSALAAEAHSQVMSYDFYTFRLNNMYNVNPAYSGKGDGLNVMLNAQSQNQGVPYANKNFMLGVFSKISAKQALGGKIINDTRGPFQLLRADLSYAYIAKINEESSLTMGILAGVLNNNLVTSRIENYDLLSQTDPTLTKSYYNTTQFAAGAGLLYSHKALDVSVSLPHIVSTNQPLNGYTHAAAFYTIKAGDKFKVTPWICYQSIPVTKSVFSGYVKGMYKDMLWLQAGYQSNQTFHAMFGVNVENFSLGYGFRFSNKQFNDVSKGSHEVSFSIKIPQRTKTGNRPVSDNASLNEIIARLDKLSKENVTSTNRENIKAELERIKQLLSKAEIDNSSPAKAEEVSKQLMSIDEKLKFIEKRLLNEN
ncbi:MAG: PorP/SprF family type IX secretion system membrane protein [Bacteroidota bacterium]